MKAAFVVALVLLCGCYAARLRSGKDFALRNKAPRDTTLRLRNPCSYSFKYTMSYDQTTEEGQIWRYDDSTRGFSKSEGKKYYTIMRNDIRQESDPRFALFVTTLVGDDGSCAIVDSYYDFPGNTFNTPSWLASLTSVDCVQVTQTTLDGKECTLCERLLYGYTSYFYIIDDHIVYYDDGYTHYNMTEYIYKDFSKEFAIDKKCVSDTLPAAVYEPPTNDECKAEFPVVKLKVLPCTYMIKYTDEGYGTGWYRRYGQNEMDSFFNEGWTSNITSLLRTDIHEPGVNESALFLAYYSDHDECEEDDYDYVIPGTGSVSEFSSIFFSVYEKDLRCDRLNKTTWKGQKCKCCTVPPFEGSTSPTYLYIKDELIIGLEDSVGNITFEYVFEDMRNDFAVDTMCVFTSLPDDIHAPPPEVENCDHKPKSRSAASSISVVASMILSMVMISLISLF